jgi:tRNA A37 threonylcarbamoyladenosine biosynthesis protein TsaE
MSALCFVDGNVVQDGLLATGKATLVRRYANQLRIHRDARMLLS